MGRAARFRDGARAVATAARPAGAQRPRPPVTLVRQAVLPGGRIEPPFETFVEPTLDLRPERPLPPAGGPAGWMGRGIVLSLLLHGALMSAALLYHPPLRESAGDPSIEISLLPDEAPVGDAEADSAARDAPPGKTEIDLPQPAMAENLAGTPPDLSVPRIEPSPLPVVATVETLPPEPIPTTVEGPPVAPQPSGPPSIEPPPVEASLPEPVQPPSAMDAPALVRIPEPPVARADPPPPLSAQPPVADMQPEPAPPAPIPPPPQEMPILGALADAPAMEVAAPVEVKAPAIEQPLAPAAPPSVHTKIEPPEPIKVEARIAPPRPAAKADPEAKPEPVAPPQPTAEMRPSEPARTEPPKKLSIRPDRPKSAPPELVRAEAPKPAGAVRAKPAPAVPAPRGILSPEDGRSIANRRAGTSERGGASGQSATLYASWKSKVQAIANRRAQGMSDTEYQGTVRVSVTIDRAGTVLSSQVQSSSGRSAVDRAGLRAVAAAYPPVPDGTPAPHTLTIGIIFKVND